MKKHILLLPTAIFPYYILLTLFFMFQTESDGFSILFPGLLVLAILSLTCSAIWLLRGITRKRSALELAKVSMVLKLIHIPAYGLIFLCGCLFFITIFTLGISLALILLDILTIVASGLTGLAAVLRCRSEQLLSPRAALLHAILQFMFCADIISAILIYRKTKSAR